MFVMRGSVLSPPAREESGLRLKRGVSQNWRIVVSTPAPQEPV